ncbi:hypothetical protein SAMN05216196_105148 [Lutimaribacter pacificus]|uniref:DEAD/DEAH-box helicase domain-containing protein n=1 Tax=Lutimaribacter pacificus TaxID=391948 RepID=A0A1H0J5J9_9RHOB|nr:DEAD/DEAH box helicase [Lutimaribacter pacificus]SDO38954.1 hypothetical protein SAMN05216196_105148 [Lutimaribacter pacificus]SHK13687.1 hypothetical protein SAMN05444142_103392 [Lutimaribacter pacificus]
MGSPVSPLVFVQQMEKHWVETLGNSSSEQLRAVWRQLGSGFGEAITSHGKPEGRTWRVLQPPTGTGKTQGLCVYAAMLASQNATMEDAGKTGMLVVTQLIAQCNEVVERVNSLAGAEVAMASHSESRPQPLSMASSAILVITHQAFINAVKAHAEGKADRWSEYAIWRYGQRELIVIDEALSNMVEESQVKSSSISQALGLIPEQTKLAYRSQVSALETVHDIFNRASKIISENPNSGLTSTKMAWRGTMAMPPYYKMDGLREALWNHSYDKSVLGKESSADRHRLRDKVDETLRSVEAVMANWGYYARVGDENTLNFASLVVPDDLPGAVVMDATATQNFLWRLFEKKALVYPVPADARSYQNVTLHVARSKGVGKGAMLEHHKDRIPRLIEDLEGRLSDDRKVFLCCHKAVEPFAKTFVPKFASFDIGHWGAIDGRNDWKDCDVAVLFGLSFRDPIWANNTFMAFRGRQEDEWFDEPAFEEHSDVRREMQNRQISVSVIQAINRVQCRKVVDSAGNCLPTDVFIVLPEGVVGEAVLTAIKAEMPHIRTTEWDFVLDGTRKKKPKIRRGSAHEALLAYMLNQSPGEYRVAKIKADLELSDSLWKESIAKALRDADHPLTKNLAGIKVSYVAGSGRGAKSRLVKL